MLQKLIQEQNLTQSTFKFNLESQQKQVSKFIIEKNHTLDYLEKQKWEQELKLKDFKTKLKTCGHFVTIKYYCKKCETEGEAESLLAFKKEIHTCGVRFCNKPDCICQRFAQTFQDLSIIKRFKNLRTLHHFSIGFQKVSKEDFENNFNKLKKKQEFVLNSFFKKLRKAGVDIQAYRVLDISKGIKDDGGYFMHYHFIALPFKSQEARLNLLKIQLVRKQMLHKQKNKISFHFQSFGLKKKEALFSYISLRAVGCYKKLETKEKDYKIYEARSLRISLKERKFMLLSELINEEQYLKYFYKHRHLNKIGDLPNIRYGSNTADNIVLIRCKKHGNIPSNDRNRVRIELNIDLNPPPPPNFNNSIELNRIFLVNALEVQKINKETGYQPFSKHYINPISDIKIKNFEDIQPLSEFDKSQIRFNRVLDIRLKNKIKLSSGELIELAIKGMLK